MGRIEMDVNDYEHDLFREHQRGLSEGRKLKQWQLDGAFAEGVSEGRAQGRAEAVKEAVEIVKAVEREKWERAFGTSAKPHVPTWQEAVSRIEAAAKEARAQMNYPQKDVPLTTSDNTKVGMDPPDMTTIKI